MREHDRVNLIIIAFKGLKALTATHILNLNSFIV